MDKSWFSGWMLNFGGWVRGIRFATDSCANVIIFFSKWEMSWKKIENFSGPGVYAYCYDDAMGLLQCSADSYYQLEFFCFLADVKRFQHPDLRNFQTWNTFIFGNQKNITRKGTALWKEHLTDISGRPSFQKAPGNCWHCYGGKHTPREGNLGGLWTS